MIVRFRSLNRLCVVFSGRSSSETPQSPLQTQLCEYRPHRPTCLSLSLPRTRAREIAARRISHSLLTRASHSIALYTERADACADEIAHMRKSGAIKLERQREWVCADYTYLHASLRSSMLHKRALS